MEEFYKSSVLWADDHVSHPISRASAAGPDYSSGRSISVPVDIPATRRPWIDYSSDKSISVPVDIPATRHPWICESDDDDYVADSRTGMSDPPHVLVAHSRREGKVAFSLCSGQGRTLKGRDLSRVRDSVLRMTGFLEG